MSEDNPHDAYNLPLNVKMMDLSNGNNVPVGKDTIGLGRALAPQKVLSYAVDLGLQQIVQSTGQHFQTELKGSALMLEDGRRYLDFPLSAALDPSKTSEPREQELTIFRADFHAKSDKYELLRSLRESLMVNTPIVLCDDICMAADELVTNALYNAPGKRNRSDANPTERPATLFYGIYDDRVVLGCQDLYGSLKIDNLIQRIHDCYKHGASKMINWCDDEGAGIGLFMLFHSCTSLYIGVEPGKRTVVCCGFPLKGGTRRRLLTPKNLHLVLCQA